VFGWIRAHKHKYELRHMQSLMLNSIGKKKKDQRRLVNMLNAVLAE
jgi:hypothetical protein